MRWTVWKYATPLDGVRDRVTLALPAGARVLSVANQGESLVVYALVNPDEKRTEPHAFYVMGTGHVRDDIPADARFLGTVLFLGGQLVFHVWGVGLAALLAGLGGGHQQQGGEGS